MPRKLYSLQSRIEIRIPWPSLSLFLFPALFASEVKCVGRCLLVMTSRVEKVSVNWVSNPIRHRSSKGIFDGVKLSQTAHSGPETEHEVLRKL